MSRVPIAGMAGLGACLVAALVLLAFPVQRADAAAACEQGKALKGLGRIAAAEKAYEKALEADPAAECAEKGLEAFDEKEECAAGSALAANDAKDEAKKAYAKALEARPESACAAQGLKDASGSSIWEEIATIAGYAVTVLSALALAGALLFLLVALVLRGLLRLRATRDLSLLRPLRRPSLSIATLDDTGLEKHKLGAGATALLREKIELGSGSQAFKLTAGESTDAEKWITKVGEIGDQGKVASAILGLAYMAWPRTHVEVSGAFQAGGDRRGGGVSLELHEGGDSRGAATLWASRFWLPIGEDVGSLQGLMVPAAAWVSHVVTKETGGKNLAASDATSWALFKAGVEHQRAGEFERAELVYREALDIDESNYGAQANLAFIEAGFGGYVRAIPRLREALVILERG